MSSFRLAFVLSLLLTLQACGFQPLYQRDQSDTTVGAGNRLETIRVRPIAHRVGQELRNYLYDALTPKGQPASPEWELNVKLSETIEQIALEQTAFSTRANLTLKAVYSLTPVVGGDSTSGAEKTGHQGTAHATGSYNILDSEYATLVAERDARARAVQVLSDDIRRQLAIWFNSLQP